ncbi:MAG: maleylpyruvate isomerase family mycothiol-dependent enzyme [Acidimicrobiia bacterium]|nr:maleylpyruvate isomerase family mycothiol-dependent enzyme [Acidimicrobiia bacterium]
MREILSDLVAEQQQLDQFLQTLRTRQWETKTPAEGWTIQDTVSHLAYTEALAAEVIEQGRPRIDAEAITDIDSWTDRGVQQGRGRRHQEIIEWWRFGRADVVEALSRMLATERIEWIHGDMSARTFATTRLMETWAHGLDIKASILGRMTPLETPPDDVDEDEWHDPLEDTPRLRHIAHLGQMTLPYAFSKAGEEFPKDGIRVEVMGPLYAAWRFGPEDTDQVIKGMAGDWCRVVVRRQDAADTGLKAVGEQAERALEIARAY